MLNIESYTMAIAGVSGGCGGPFRDACEFTLFSSSYKSRCILVVANDTAAVDVLKQNQCVSQEYFDNNRYSSDPCIFCCDDHD